MASKVDSDFDKPPPYKEMEDEFESFSKPKNSSPSIVQPSTTSTFTFSSPIPTPEINGKGDSDLYENEIFRRPPKFLLHSSEGHDELDEFKLKGDNLDGRQMDSPSAHPIPPVFAVPAGGFNVHSTVYPSQRNSVAIPSRALLFDEHMPRRSQRILCPYCRKGVNTRIEYVNGTMTHLAAIAACWFTCLFCIPYFIKELKDVEHFCPDCGKMLGCDRQKIIS